MIRLCQFCSSGGLRTQYEGAAGDAMCCPACTKRNAALVRVLVPAPSPTALARLTVRVECPPGDSDPIAIGAAVEVA